MASVKYWIWLANQTTTQPEASRLLLEHFSSPEAVYIADREAYRRVPRITTKTLSSLEDKSLESVDKILSDCDRLNIRILTMHDGDYPERLSQLEDPPAVLYVKGRLPRFDGEIAIGIVGARQPSEYGKAVAGRLAWELTSRGALVISGMAQGIDTATLRGALKAGGPVVSVVAGGMDRPYPHGNRYLYDDVAAVGALLSEYPPGTTHDGWHFPIRNRIISGLALGVVAVECKVHSGTMITIHKALEQNRDVFAVPGNVDSPMSAGPISLIRDGAIPVASAQDIMNEYADRFPEKIRPTTPLSVEALEQRLKEPPSTEKPKGKKEPKVQEKPPPQEGPPQVVIDVDDPVIGLTDDQKDILRALEGKTLLTDAIVEVTQIPTRRVLSALTMLQVKGYVSEASGKRFQVSIQIQRGE